MELPVDECLLLKLLLVDSNMSLPLSQREASGYNVNNFVFSVVWFTVSVIIGRVSSSMSADLNWPASMLQMSSSLHCKVG